MPIDPSKIIKEYFKTADQPLVIIRVDGYMKDLEGFIQLFNFAKNVFPKITPADVDVVMYSDDRHEKMTGIEFNVSDITAIPSDYRQIDKLIPRH